MKQAICQIICIILQKDSLLTNFCQKMGDNCMLMVCTIIQIDLKIPHITTLES